MKSSDYLQISIILALVSAAMFYFQRPSFTYLVDGYPALTEAQVIEGVINVRHKEYIHKSGWVSHSIKGNDVIDQHGERHDLNYLFHQSSKKYKSYRFIDPIHDGTKAKVWLHPVFGVLQAEYQKSDAQQEAFRKALPKLFNTEQKPSKKLKKKNAPSKYKPSENIGIASNKDIIQQLFTDSYQEIKQLNVLYLDSRNGISLIFLIIATCSIITYFNYLKHHKIEKDAKLKRSKSSSPITAVDSSKETAKKKPITLQPTIIRVAIWLFNVIPLAYFLYFEGPCLAYLIKAFLSPDQTKIYECTSLSENPMRFFWVFTVCIVCSLILKLYYHYNFVEDSTTEN